MMKKSTVLITGIDGFLGSNLFKSLRNTYDVIGIERRTNHFLRINEGEVKVYNTENIETAFKENQIDFVIHTATHHCKKFSNYGEVFDTNFSFGMALYDLAILKKVKCFINMDTILSKNINLYSYTKNIFRETISFLSKNKQISVINVKLDMMYGFNSGNHNFINSMIKRMLSGIKSIDLTSGKQRRSFLYINDIVKAINLIIKNYNLFNNRLYNEFHLIHPELNTIEEVMLLLKELTNSKTTLNFGALDYRRNEIMETPTEYSIYEIINWKPEYTLREGLMETLQN